MSTETTYKWLEPKPSKKFTKQLGIKGRNMTVWNLVAEVVVSERTPEEVAKDFDLSLEAVQEAPRHRPRHCQSPRVTTSDC